FPNNVPSRSVAKRRIGEEAGWVMSLLKKERKSMSATQFHGCDLRTRDTHGDTERQIVRECPGGLSGGCATSPGGEPNRLLEHAVMVQSFYHPIGVGKICHVRLEPGHVV